MFKVQSAKFNVLVFSFFPTLKFDLGVLNFPLFCVLMPVVVPAALLFCVQKDLVYVGMTGVFFLMVVV